MAVTAEIVVAGGRTRNNPSAAAKRRARTMVVAGVSEQGASMNQVRPGDEDLLAGARRPDHGPRLPRLSWTRMLHPGVSGKVMIGLFFATLFTVVAVAFLVGHT